MPGSLQPAFGRLLAALFIEVLEESVRKWADWLRVDAQGAPCPLAGRVQKPCRVPPSVPGARKSYVFLHSLQLWGLAVHLSILRLDHSAADSSASLSWKLPSQFEMGVPMDDEADASSAKSSSCKVYCYTRHTKKSKLCPYQKAQTVSISCPFLARGHFRPWPFRVHFFTVAIFLFSVSIFEKCTAFSPRLGQARIVSIFEKMYGKWPCSFFLQKWPALEKWPAFASGAGQVQSVAISIFAPCPFLGPWPFFRGHFVSIS